MTIIVYRILLRLLFNIKKLFSCDNIHPAIFILNLRFKMKSLELSRWLCKLPRKKISRIPVDYLSKNWVFSIKNTQKWGFSVNLGRANVVCRVRWAIIWTRSVQYIEIFIKINFVYYPVYIILLINILIEKTEFSIKKYTESRNFSEPRKVWPHLTGGCDTKYFVLSSLQCQLWLHFCLKVYVI